MRDALFKTFCRVYWKPYYPKGNLHCTSWISWHRCMKCVEKVDSERENDFLRKLYCVVVFLGFLEMWWRNCRIPPAENSRPAFPCPQWVWSAQFAVTKLQSYKDCKVTKLQPQHGHDITLTRHLSSNLADKRKREQEEFLKITCDKKLH